MALRRREAYDGPRRRLAASSRPSRGIARRFEARLPSRVERTWVPLGPLGVSTPSGLLGTGRPARLSPIGRPPCAFAFLPRSLSSTRAVPSNTRIDRSDDAPFPGLSCRTTHDGAADPRDGRGSAPPACRVRGLRPPSRRPPPSLPAPCGVGASIGFPPRGLLLASIGRPLGRPCPPGVHRIGSLASPGSGRMRATSGRRSRREYVRSAGSTRDPARRCLHEVHPPRAFAPCVLASRFGRARSPFTFGSVDVSTGPRRRVLRIEGIGSPLSGPPARSGFLTL